MGARTNLHNHFIRNLCKHPPDSDVQIQPTGDLVLVKVARAEEKTAGGIILPDSAQKVRRPSCPQLGASSLLHLSGLARCVIHRLVSAIIHFFKLSH